MSSEKSRLWRVHFCDNLFLSNALLSSLYVACYELTDLASPFSFLLRYYLSLSFFTLAAIALYFSIKRKNKKKKKERNEGFIPLTLTGIIIIIFEVGSELGYCIFHR